MKKIPVRQALVAAGLILGLAWTAAAEVREAGVAGQFYPDDPKDLRELITEYLDRQPAPSGGKPRALIVPHAGYQYSGIVAAHAYRQLQGQHYHGVVIVGLTHRLPFPAASVDTVEAYRTPLGEVPVDQEAVAVLRTYPFFSHWEKAHQTNEHSLEVQIPFLQTVFERVRIVPILVGTNDPGVASRLAEALARLARLDDYLFIFSTDLSHYHSYSVAEQMDEATVQAILSETPQAVHRLFERGSMEACGRGPILTGLFLSARLGYLRKALLTYANSGDTAGTPNSVVGYAAIALYGPPAPSGDRISPEAGAALVAAARQTLQEKIGAGPAAGAPDLRRYPELKRAHGMFVTLRKHGELRGCIGRIEASEPLARLVPDVALDAALRDSRFSPVTAQELPELQVEVSVLTPPVKIAKAEEIVPGRDGVILESQGHSGVFLPQVWEESGWTRIEFLRQLASQKAGLPPEAWQQATLSVFEDQAFGEEAPQPSGPPLNSATP